MPRDDHIVANANHYEKADIKKQRLSESDTASEKDESSSSYTRVYLNEKKNISLSAGETRYFTYTPEGGYYFTVETYGSCDPKIKVWDIFNNSIIDDDSGLNRNAKIEFKGVQGQPIYIATKLFDPTASGNYSIQLRKQRISMFAYEDDNDNTTIPDLETPYNKFNEIFEAIKYENESAADALSNDNRDLAKINSEIMFFSGHGYKNSSTEKGFGVAFKKGGITTSTFLNMDRTKVAMWSACYSANSTNSDNISIAEYSVKNGAKSAIGFTESVSFSSSHTFTNRFFTKLSEGARVREAASYGAKGLLWPWDNAKKYTIFGDDDLTIASQSTSTASFSMPAVNTNILAELSDDVYVVDLDQTSKRYYERINNILTNSFVDVTYNESNEIIRIENYRKNVGVFMSINNIFRNKELPNHVSRGQNIYRLREETSRNIVYVSLNNVMTPVEITIGHYSNDEITIEETRCINLTNGRNLEYSELSSM